jgi:hypothetical protein
VTKDSTKLLTEKLSLARELATLQPELEHLRSQATYQQTVLSEKLALQREVSTLEVELEAEKRAAKRSAQKNDIAEREAEYQSQLDGLQKDLAREKRDGTRSLSEMENELRCQLEEVQRELAREKRETAKLTREHEKETKESATRYMALENKLEQMRRTNTTVNELEKGPKTSESLPKILENKFGQMRDTKKATMELEKELKASEARANVLESKLEQTRTKLRAVKDQLKESQEEANQLRGATETAVKAVITDAQAKRSRKRSALEMSADNNFGTPDGPAARGKRHVANRGRADQTLVGEKSMFSITPFLNRTINVAPETPAKEEESEDEQAKPKQAAGIDDASTKQVPQRTGVPSPTATPKPRGKKTSSDKTTRAVKSVLGEANANVTNNKPAPKKVRPLSKLDNVIEENEETQGTINEEEPLATKSKKAARPLKLQKQLLGGTLFDSEDGEPLKRPSKVSLGPSNLLGRGGLAGPGGQLKGGLATGSAFGGFSPLKKDRRGVRASFLA